MGTKNKVKNSLRLSFLEGAFNSCMQGFVLDYVTPYALALKATTRQIGALIALPSLVSSLTQFNPADITEKLKSRKKVLNIFVFLHAIMLLPVIFIPWCFNKQPVLFLIIFITLFTGFNTLASPVMSGLLSEYIPYKMRGKYFGWRGRIMSIIMIGCSLLAGLILQVFKSQAIKGFVIIFSLALIARLISWFFMTRMYEPVLRSGKNAYFGFVDFAKGIRKSNFGRFVLFVAGLQFCVNIAAPFFPVFMLRDLKFDYITYTIVTSTVMAVQILTIGRWGRVADKIGNVRVLKFTGMLIASLPLWWLVSHNPVYLVFAQAVSGFAWAGFNLCASNFIFDAVTPQKRIRCIGYLNVFVGFGVFIASNIGGQIANTLPNIFGYRILTLFLIASILRFLTVFYLGVKIEEVRQTEVLNIKEVVFSVIGIKRV